MESFKLLITLFSYAFPANVVGQSMSLYHWYSSKLGILDPSSLATPVVVKRASVWINKRPAQCYC